MNTAIRKRRSRALAEKGDALYNALGAIVFTLFALLCAYPFYYLFICTISAPSLVEVGRISVLA